jgi:TonB family protein
MVRHRELQRLVGATIVLILAWPALVSAQDSISAAEALYASAAYDEALAVLDRLQVQSLGVEQVRQVQEDRALCLLALGRPDAANLAIAAVVNADPLYRPDEATASPRVRAAFKDVRSRLLPDIVEARYRDARALYDKQEWADALKALRQVQALAADPDLDEAQLKSVEDYRVLAGDFARLADAAANPPAPPTPNPAAEPPPATPAPKATVDYSRVFDASNKNVTPPATVRQDLPRWINDGRPGPRDGTIEVTISAGGVVERATLTQSMSPFFDRQVLEATRNWRYEPARLDGRPVRYRKVIRVTFQ